MLVFALILTTVKPEHRKRMLYHRLINLISTSYLSLLAQFGHIVTVTPVHLCVCVFCTLGVLLCNPYLGVCVLTVFLAELLILFHAFADALCYSHTSSYVCHCLFCTLDILDGYPFIAVHPFLHRERFVDCTHKNISVFSRFCVFPSHFFTVNKTSVTMFFSLACPA